jgi:hypothetical protein
MAMPPQLRWVKRRNYKRLLFEELVSLDARWLARHRMIPKDWGRRVYPNFAFVIPHIATLILTARTAEIILCDGREQTVAIHWQHNGGIGYNSIRPMFVCRCGYGAFRLYDVYGAFRCYCCATALGVRYASQQVSRKGRKYLQSQRLRRFLGEYPGLSTIRKPLFMHRKTYSALLTKLRHIETNPESRKYKSKRLNRAHAKAHQYVSGRGGPHCRCLASHDIVIAFSPDDRQLAALKDGVAIQRYILPTTLARSLTRRHPSQN